MGIDRYRRILFNRLRDRLGRGNRGKWNHFYTDLSDTELYGDEVTYQLAADFLADAGLVEDWGCGSGGFRRFCRNEYVGIDGSHSPFADKIADLADYRSKPGGIMMRHVLEHDYRWQRILDNAVASFRSKMCLILFTPLAAKTSEIAYDHDFGVPDISFSESDVTDRFGSVSWHLERDLRTDTQYGVEHVFYLTKHDE